MTLPCLLAVLSGCFLWIPAEEHASALDGDGDGWDFEDDCADADGSVHPGAPEACNGLDDDCDGAVDEEAQDAPAWHPDADRDGWGSAEWEIASCSAPALGYVQDGTDCDDGDGAIHPGASETCDGEDQDCDGTPDDDATDAATWYSDQDADGFGDPASPLLACEAPSDAVADATDCDDGDATFHPGAPEPCDGLDQDCTGVADDPVPWYRDEDGDGWGDPLSVTWSCEAPPDRLSDGSDCDDSDSRVHPGGDEVCLDGKDGDCDGTVDACILDLGDHPHVTGSDGVGAGFQVDLGQDVTLDGLPDALVVGQACPGTSAWVLPETGVEGSLSSLAFPVDTYEACSALAGILAGDLDGDGLGDLALGNPGTGTAWVLAGPFTVSTSTDAGRRLAGAWSEASSLAAGDLDGDEVRDLLVGSTRSTEAAWILPGPITADGSLSDGVSLRSPSPEEGAGTDLATADLDGDGQEDVVVGAPNHGEAEAENAGAVYVVLGPVTASVALTSAHATLVGKAGSAWSGQAVAVPGDTDGDGYDDILVGAPFSTVDGVDLRGEALLVRGPVTGRLSLSSALATFQGDLGEDYAGWAVAGGDLDRDGLSDVAVGAMGHDTGGRNAGGAFLWFGPVTGTWTLSEAQDVLLGSQSGDGAGLSLALGAGSDGTPALLVGAPDAQDGDGGAWFVTGGAP